MPQNTLFLLKNCEDRRALGAPSPDPLASGGWEFYPRSAAFVGWRFHS